jgi:S-adenosyl-L-methionine hydrolase (adenosine-forming)
MGTFITLTTDFGTADGYVSAMKGVIYSLNPEATVVDISHNIQSQNIRQAAFVLSTVHSYFPSYTIHLVVVDPGVGSNRRAVIVKTPKAHFVAPDNGVLSYIVDAYQPQPIPDSQRVKLSPELKAYAITRSEYWRKPVSNTFHGRDIFAPVAARLSLGLMASSLGDEIDTLTTFAIPRPYRQDEMLIGQILHIDNFGNLITSFQESFLQTNGQSTTIIIGDRSIHGIARTYSESSGPTALFGSSGYLEIAVANGYAADFFRAKVGDEIKIKLGGSL